VHFAVDDHEVAMCAELKGGKGMAKESWFLPLNQGWNDGAGNPPNPDGLIEGTGKRIRHVKVRSPEMGQDSRIVAIVRAEIEAQTAG